MKKNIRRISVLMLLILSLTYFCACGHKNERPVVQLQPAIGGAMYACVDGKIFSYLCMPNEEDKKYKWPGDDERAGVITKTIPYTRDPFVWEDGSWTMYSIEGRGFPYAYVDDDVIMVRSTSKGWMGYTVMHYYCDVMDFQP